MLGLISWEFQNAETHELQVVAAPCSAHDSFRRMIFTEQVPDFVCEYMSEKPSGLNAKLLSTFSDSEVKHVDRAGCCCKRQVFGKVFRKISAVSTSEPWLSMVGCSQAGPIYLQ